MSIVVMLSVVLAGGQFAAPVAAQESGDKLAHILDQQQALKASLDDGTSGLSPRQIRQIRKEQGEVFAIAGKNARFDQLNVQEQIRLENALERINAHFVGTRVAQENQDTCWTEAKTGSKLKVTRCGTQEERDETRRGARAWLEKPRICVPPGCS
ncbi:hypothetical protein [Aerolutibacter ruishenii]|uniref:hypothetical protein n=1 Tax=Aerolutibacter ruishenii TaxID=686800 RepID=UPI0011A10702|nr:hypothetical protein [Lysobacter ruishenii]